MYPVTEVVEISASTIPTIFHFFILHSFPIIKQNNNAKISVNINIGPSTKIPIFLLMPCPIQSIYCCGDE